LKYVVSFKRTRFNILVLSAKDRIDAVNIVKEKHPEMIEHEDFEVNEITITIEPYFTDEDVLVDG